MSRLLCLLLLTCSTILPARAQWSEDFSDGNFSEDPAWSGDVDRWRLVPRGLDHALQSDGPQARDTLTLATPSSVSTGRWHFTFAYDSVNLSNFNGLRVFLMADTDALKGPVHGYYLQFGANNSDQVRLYRMDGDPSAGRVLLGASADELVADFSGELNVSITHSAYGTWSVMVNGAEVIGAHDATYDESRYFGFWIKHTDDHRQSYMLDDIHVELAPASEYPRPEPGDIVVNEIMYDPAPGGSEYVELYNRSETIFDLGRLLLADDTRVGRRIVRRTTPFAPGTYAVLVENGHPFDESIPAYELENWPSLNNDGDAVLLLSGETIIDAAPYSATWGGVGVSLERRDPRGPSWHPVNFGSSQSKSGGTPGRENSIYSRDRTPPEMTFVEEVADDLLHIYFNEPIATAALLPSQLSGEGLSPSRVHVISDTLIAASFPGEVAFGSLMTHGVEDLFGNNGSGDARPIAWRPAPGELVINELLHNPINSEFDGLPNQPEYVELYNAGDRLLTLHRAFLTGPANEEAVADTSWFGEKPLGLPPGRYAVIFAGVDLGMFEQVFTVGSDAVRARVDNLGLANAGDLVRLHRADGDTLEALAYDSGWEAPLAGPGTSLERIDARAPPNDPLNWSSSREGGTPGRRNSITPHPEAREPEPGELVINEIMFAPADEAPEYIELYNNGKHVLELNGLYMSGPDGSDSLRIAYVPTALAPGEYAVMHSQPAPAAGFPQNAHLLLATAALLGLGNEGELIAFYNSDGTLLTSIHYLPDWHHPHLKVTKGVALERFHPDASAHKPASWSSSVAASGGTPGKQNSIFVAPSETPQEGMLSIQPVTFSPDGDGFDDATHLSYTLESKAPRIRIRIFDDHGRLVRTLRQSALSGRTGSLLWDGRDAEGHDLPVGIYIVLLEAVDPARGIVEAYKAPVVVAR